VAGIKALASLPVRRAVVSLAVISAYWR